MDQTYQQAERMGAPRAKALCHCFGGRLDLLAGNWNDAASELEKGLELYGAVGSASGLALTRQALGELLTGQGRLKEARDHLNEGIVVAERAAMRSHCLTRLYAALTRNWLAAEDLESASHTLEEGLITARRHGHCVTCNALLLPEAVRVRVATSDIEGAAEFAAELEEIASRFDSKAWWAMAHQARARVHIAQRQHEEAAALLELAKNEYLEFDRVYEAARCLMTQAASVLAAGGKGSKTRAQGLREEAEAIFARLGAAGVEL